MKNKYIYDLEVFPNFFSSTFVNTKDSLDKRVFIVFDKTNQSGELHDFLRDSVEYLIGYNNKKYDDLILNYIIENSIDFSWGDSNEITKQLYGLSNLIIKTENYWQDKDLKRLTWANNFKSLDLMKILAFDKSKVGLKQCAVNLKWYKIQDLPHKYNEDVKTEEVEEILA